MIGENAQKETKSTRIKENPSAIYFLWKLPHPQRTWTHITNQRKSHYKYNTPTTCACRKITTRKII